MKKLSIILACALIALLACTKSKEIYPEIGDGNDEIIIIGIDNVTVKYTRNDIGNLQKVIFHYSLIEEQQFEAAEMTKKSDCFEVIINNLFSDTIYSYYYELYPYNSNLFLTQQKSFRTQSNEAPTPPTPPTPPSDVPEGAINGLFTINDNGDQVYFSQGNLQYQASTNTWRFAESQFSFVGGVDFKTNIEWGNQYENGVKCDNTLLSSTYNGWIDLFCWGTSGYYDVSDPYVIHYQPWEAVQYTVNTQYNLVGYGPSINMPSPNLTGLSANYDWGVFNAIKNGGNVANQWRTLSKDEWEYIIDNRNTVSGVRYAKCMVDGYESLILLPDSWNSLLYDLHNVNLFSASFNSNIITLATWEDVFENEGAVLLLAAGVRSWDFSQDVVHYMRNGLTNGGDLLSYWTTTFGDEGASYCCFFTDYWGGPSCLCARDTGRSVRLVHDANNNKYTE